MITKVLIIFLSLSSFAGALIMNRCIICGAPIKNGLNIYCSDCLYELKRVRLADEESLQDFIERHMDLQVKYIQHENLPKLERWFEL